MSEQSKQMRELALDSPSKSLAKVLLEFADYMESTDSRRKSLESTIEQQQQRIAELESYNVRLAVESHEKSLKIDELSATVEWFRDQLSTMAAQHHCGCEHPACNRCRDDADNREVLQAT